MSKLTSQIKNMRINMIKMAYAAAKAGAHIGPALSLAEIIATLYFSVMKFDPKNPKEESRDRLILSKGHGVIAQYAALAQLGLIKEEELATFKQNETRLHAHPTMNPELGIEFSSGSLGMGVSLACGVCLALKKKKNNAKTFVIVGDGECNEGSIWEGVMFASHQKLDNLVLIVDKNDIQYDDFTSNVLSMSPLDKKFESFGFEVAVVDGHNVDELERALKRKSDKPLAIIAQTIKGRGVSFMENEPQWHNGVLTQELYEKAMNELGGEI